MAKSLKDGITRRHKQRERRALSHPEGAMSIRPRTTNHANLIHGEFQFNAGRIVELPSARPSSGRSDFIRLYRQR